MLGESVDETRADDLKVISEKLEVINLQLAHRKTTIQKVIHWLFISLCVVIVFIFSILITLNSPYLGWDYNNPETSVAGVIFHAFEWLFVRIAPFALFGAILGISMTRKKV